MAPRRSPSPGSEMRACNRHTPSSRRYAPGPRAQESVHIGNTPKLFGPGFLDSLSISLVCQVALSLTQAVDLAKYHYLALKAMTGGAKGNERIPALLIVWVQ